MVYHKYAFNAYQLLQLLLLQTSMLLWWSLRMVCSKIEPEFCICYYHFPLGPLRLIYCSTIKMIHDECSLLMEVVKGMVEYQIYISHLYASILALVLSCLLCKISPILRILPILRNGCVVLNEVLTMTLNFAPENLHSSFRNWTRKVLKVPRL